LFFLAFLSNEVGMRISRRTSGGRGEYEISEEAPGGVTPHDLVDHRILLDLGHSLILDTGCVLRHAQGKFRMRRIRPDADMQLHRQLVAALLLPEAIRANATMGGGMPIIQKARYAVETVEVASVQRQAGQAALAVGEVILSNADHAAEELHFDRRIAGLIRLWQERQKLPVEMQILLERHEILVSAGGPLHRDAEMLVSDLQSILSDQAADLGIAYNEYTDALPPLLELLDVQIAEPAVRVEDIDPEEVALRRRTAREWRRWASHRGTDSARFRAKVRDAYDATCLVCGKRFPPTDFNRVPGVDAAHILPWADYDLDRTDNGVCLCKLCHWAFDEGIIVIMYENGQYLIDVSPRARTVIEASGIPFSLDALEQLTGQVPEDRLPCQPGDRPNPQFLEELQRKFED